jgi:hypothetical protein
MNLGVRQRASARATADDKEVTALGHMTEYGGPGSAERHPCRVI